MRERKKRPREESSPSDGELTLIEMAILHLGDKIGKLTDRVAALERRK